MINIGRPIWGGATWLLYCTEKRQQLTDMSADDSTSVFHFNSVVHGQYIYNHSPSLNKTMS